MHRNVISLASILALLVGAISFAGVAEAHEGEKQCNVLLDGDGEPVKESDSDDIDHSNSHACGPDEKAAVDAQGSAEAAEEEEASKQVANVTAAPVEVDPLTVYFDTGSSELSAGSEAEVQAFVEQLQATNPKNVTVVGYTDSSGSADLNQKLSKARAANVTASLVEAGLTGSLVTQDAVGEDTLAVETPNGTREPNNRRVVVSAEY